MASSFVSNSIVNAVAGIFTMLGGFLSTILIARLLGVQATGVVAFATWLVTMTIIVSDLGITGCLPRFLPELLAKRDDETADHLAWKLFTSFFACITLAAICLLAYATWLLIGHPENAGWWISAETFATTPAFWLLVAAASCLQALANFTTCWLKGRQDFGTLAQFAVATCIVQIFGTATGALLFGITGALAAMAAGALLPATLLLRLRATSGALSAPLRRRVTRFSLETWGSYLLTAFFASRMEVFFLERSWGSHAVGLFTVSLTLSNLATQGPLLLTGALLPKLAGHLGRDEAAKARQVYASSVCLLALLVLPACLGTAAILPVVLPLMYGPAFAPAITTATVLLGSAALVATASVASVYLIAIERTRFLLATALAGAAVSILAGLTIVPAYGPIAAAWGRGGVQIAIAVATLWYIHKRLACPTPAVALTKLLAAAVLCAVVARLIVIVMPNWPGVIMAILGAALTYAAANKLLRPLPLHDVANLRNAVQSLPARLRPAANAGLQLIWS